jgi:hypothetical protein
LYKLPLNDYVILPQVVVNKFRGPFYLLADIHR